MDLYRIIDDLMAERDRIDRIIRSLETGGPNGRVGAKRRGRKFMDAAGRKEVSDRMKRYWDAKRKGEAAAGRGD